MVCMLGRWRMADVVKLLKVENHSEVTSEEINDEKIANQLLHKGFLDADEANLLQEEDMHVFGYKPMADPLHLVCCNSCQKPVRASQYTAHAERCSPLTSKRDSPSGINNAVKASKPPTRKGKKTSDVSTSDQNASIGIKVKKELVDKSHGQLAIGMENHNLSSGGGHGSTVTVQETDDTNFSSTSSRGMPHPLATKMYRCQRNSQLRFELSQIYHGACGDGYFGNCSDLGSMQVNGVVNSHTSSHIDLPHEVDENKYVQTKQSKLYQKEAILPRGAVNGLSNGRYHSMNPNCENSVKQVNGSCPG
ncbi:SAGA-associated factor 11 [Rhynchospora pubera]|uniref:SAGA-associated factor 11 n=1 Tax=Rhynchospora pubera TaxID=906938 RepID=A0AAV8EJP3_9POAL|nr:SAGA-associated factor 11 [Rhynchospora pubera]